ncbi:MAG TPA: hypothetical protein VFE13_11970, partial [Caulobacteraceae bacterium]|nr:hypothetical protein [Caulobacteraceae bacterium]
MRWRFIEGAAETLPSPTVPCRTAARLGYRSRQRESGEGGALGRESELRAGLSRFLAARWRPGAEASELSHIPGGASRETWRFKAGAGGEARGMIVRIDPETSLIDTDRRTEYRA